MNLKHLLSLSLLALTACGGGSDPDPDPVEPTPTTPEPNNPQTPTTPAGCDTAGLTVALSSPTAEVATKGTVTVQVALSGPADKVEKVELLRDGTLLAGLVAPYTYAWDTTGTEEGAYALTARATCGGKAVDSEARTVRVDRTAPAVTVRRPQPGAQQVAVRDAFQVEFSEPLLPASVTDAALTVKVGGTVLEKTLALSQDGRTLTVTPVGLVAPATVELTWGAGLTDRAGNALGLPSTPWSFTVPAWLAVGAAVPEETGLPFSWLPQLGFDAGGAPLVAFRVENASINSTQQALLTRRWTGDAWSEWKPRVPGPLTDVAFAADGEGRALLGYRHYQFERHGVASQYHAPGQAPLERSCGGTEYPRVALAPNGEGLLACVLQANFNGTAGSVSVTRLGATATAYPPASGSNNSSTLYDLDLAADPQGLPVISYLDADMGRLVKRYDGTQWVQAGPARILHYIVGRPALAVDTQGRPLLAYRSSESPASTTSAVNVHRLEGSAWVPLGSFSVAGYAESAEAATPVLLAGPQGRLLMAYSERTSPVRVDVREWTGSAWKSLGTLSQSGASVLVGPGGLAVDRDGRPTVAVRVSIGGDPQVQVWRLNQ